MEKRQKISWGVSFGSLALVAGMVSYLGLSNGVNAHNQTTTQDGSNNPLQQSQGNQGDSFNPSFGDDNSSQFNQGDGTAQFNQDNGSTNDNNGFGGSNQQGGFTGGGGSFGHHHGYDTTTGGT